MTLRRGQGGLVLGLLASLAAHTVLFGGDHSVGGSYHALLLQVASASAVGFLAIFATLAWSGAGTACDGSVLAARLRSWLPDVGSVAACAVLWYGCIEAVERQHPSVPLIAVVVAIVAASYLIVRLARCTTDAIARVAVAISATMFFPRLPQWQRRRAGGPLVRLKLFARRRFARPPPIAFAFIRA